MSNPFQGGDIVSVVDARDLWDAEALDTNEVYTVLHVTGTLVALEEKPGYAYHYARFILEARPSHLDGDASFDAVLAEAEHLHEGLNTPFVEEEPRSFPDAYYADYEASIGDNTPSPYPLEAPGHTDLMVSPEDIDEALEAADAAPWTVRGIPLSEMMDRLPSDRREAIEARAEELIAETDAVRQPHHYARYAIEPATFIAANKLPFDVGNVVKYVLRYDAKNGREDVLKAARYCEMLLERIDREARVAAGESASEVWKVML